MKAILLLAMGLLASLSVHAGTTAYTSPAQMLGAQKALPPTLDLALTKTGLDVGSAGYRFLVRLEQIVFFQDRAKYPGITNEYIIYNDDQPAAQATAQSVCEAFVGAFNDPVELTMKVGSSDNKLLSSRQVSPEHEHCVKQSVRKTHYKGEGATYEAQACKTMCSYNTLVKKHACFAVLSYKRVSEIQRVNEISESSSCDQWIHD